MRSKGQMQTIEALISVAIISLIIFILYFITPVSQEVSQINRKIDAYNALKVLDQSRNLRQYALQSNATKIEELLLPFLKSNYKVVLYNQTGNITEIPKIDSKNIASVSYIIAGDLSNYKLIEIRVYLW
jgi:competence protein ComGC